MAKKLEDTLFAKTDKAGPILPDGVEFSPPCLGAVGSKPFLDDITAQLNENKHAANENRDPVILPIMCRLCSGYHSENQYDPISHYKGHDFEQYAYDRIAPPAKHDVTPSPELMAIAVNHMRELNNDAEIV